MKKRKQMIAAAGIAIMALIGGTLAYFNSTLTARNELGTKKYGSELVEKFTPSGEWQPGAEVNKSVAVENTGDYDVIARITHDEFWKYKGVDQLFGQVSLKGEKDGTYSPVIKNLVNTDKWVYGNDGYYYLTEKILPGTTSVDLLRSITLKGDADMGTNIEKMYYTKAADRPALDAIGTNPNTQWVEYTGSVPEGSTFNRIASIPDPDNAGYSNANYTLNVTVQVLQATKEAVEGTWLSSSVTTKPTGAALTFLQSIR